MGWLGIIRPAIRDLVYATQSERQQMDIYLPWRKGEVDVVLLIHGGGWWEGDKSGYRDACREYARKGYAAAALNYRFIDDSPPEQQAVSYADMLDDIDAAIAALKAKLLEKGYTPRKMAVTGLSAGGHLTLLYGYSRYAQSAIPIAFLFSDVGPSDFTDPGYQDIANGPAIVEQGYRLAGSSASDLKAPSPIFHVEPGVPPTLMRYGALDDLVPASQGTRLREALDAAGVRNDLFVYPNSGHIVDTKKDAPTDALYNAKLREYFDTYF
jgi:acetyl esterase/lipase